MAENLTLEEKKALALKHFGKDTTPAPAKTQDEIDAEKLAEDERIKAEAKKKEDEQEAEGKKNTATPPAKVELTDEELQELVSQRTGRKIKSWDELKPTATEEEKKKVEEKRGSDMLSYGLKKGLFNKQQYESFIADSKDPKELVYGRELAQAKADDSEWTDEKEKEFREEFDEKFGLNLDDSAAKKKRGVKQLTMIADALLKSEYGAIYSLENEYSKHESAITSQKEQEQKVLQQAPIYKQDVESIVASLATVEVDMGGEKYTVPVSKEALEELTQEFLNTNYAGSKMAKGYTKDELTATAKQYIIAKNFNTLSFEAAKLYREKHEKGVRGIPEGGRLEKPPTDDSALTDQQKKALEFLNNALKPIVAN